MNPVRLENRLLAMDFCRRTGSLVQIEDRTSGRRILADSSRARLLRVVCPSPSWQSRLADSHEAEPPEIEGDSNRLRIHYPRLSAMDGPLEIAATIEVELPADSAEAFFTLELANNSPDRMHEVRFPWVAGWQGMAGPGQDKAHCGCMPVSPHPPAPETFAYNLCGSHRRRFVPYAPGMMLPFFDLSGGGQGLSYICYQDRPLLGGMVLENLDPEPDELSWSFAWVHMPFTEAGGSWRSPRIGIGVHQGDWHATADRFRSWVDTWWRQPAPPKRLATSIGFQTIMTRNFDGVPNHRFDDIPRLARAGLEYGIEDLCLWDPIAGVYLRPDDGDFWEEFDPSQSLDELRAALAEAKRLGTNVSTLVNFRLIRGNSSLYDRIGEAQVQRTIFGSPVIDDWSTCSSAHAAFRTGYLGRQGYALCQKSPAFRQRALDITRQTLDLGFSSLFIDQAFDYNPCFAAGHGHETPADTLAAALDWFEGAAAIVRERAPGAYVIGENGDLFALQSLDLSWNWGWAGQAPEVMRYTLPETLHCWIVDHQPRVLNRAFAMGFLMAFTTGMAEKAIDSYPAFGERVAQLAALRLRCAEFIVAGRFRDQAGLAAEGAAAYLYDAPAGVAVILANLTEEQTTARAVVDTGALDRQTAGDGTLCRQGGAEEEAGRRLGEGQVELLAELAALEVAVWMLPNSAESG